MLLLLLSCGIRQVPPHLQADPEAVPDLKATVPADEHQAIAQLVGRDPLVRRPPVGRTGNWPSFGSALTAYLDTVRENPEDPAAFEALERDHMGSVAVPLARGWRLAAVEPIATQLSTSLTAQRMAGLWLTPLRNSGVQPQDRGPWSWLPLSEVLAYGEAWVLRGWLSHPDIPVEAATTAVQDPAYGRLALSVEGQILLASNTPAPVDLQPLEQISTLLLSRFAADRDSEQAAYRKALEALSGEEAQAGDRPLLDHSVAVRTALLETGGPKAKGGALLAWQITRWLDPQLSPGMDRAQGVREVSAWSPDLDRLALIVEIAMLKDCSDRLQVGLKRERTAHLALPLADVLTGFGQGGLPQRWLERGRPEAATWLDLTRAAGAPDGTTPAEGFAALNSLLVQACDRALALPLSEEQRTLVERTRARALP